MSKWGAAARDAGKDKGGRHAAGKEDRGGLFSRNTGRHVKVKGPRSGKRAAVRDGYEKKPWWW